MFARTLTTVALFAFGTAALAGQSALEAVGKEAVGNAVKSVTPAAVKDAAKTVDQTNKAVHEAAKLPATAVPALANPQEVKAQAVEAGKSAVKQAVPAEAVDAAKTVQSGTAKAKAAKDAVGNPKEAAHQAVKTTKKQAVDSALEMLH